MAETSKTTYVIDLIVESGAAIPFANSYVSMEYADTYCKDRNYTTWLTQSEYVRKAAIIKAMDYVDNLFPWKGRKMYKHQTLSFPRVDIIDGDGFDRTGEIPEQLKKAVCEAAFYAYKQFSLFSKKDPNGAVKKDRKKADVTEIEKEYFSSSEFTIDWTSAYQSLDSLLDGLFIKKGDVSNHVCIPAVWR